nr:DEAD/DEAH box helicase family protein [Haloarchaeobius amylolyticus]
MTPLWHHQLEALRAWQKAGYRGYADMATATGKTVLGLAAIALRYGHLHPIDDVEGQRDQQGTDTVLIVAHSDLILEQWRREFDNHLNIPQDRTRGAAEIELTWGEVHFRTPQRLINQSDYDYDLVILDEAHHYATASEWGSLLEAFDADILALSGSVDDAGTDSEALQDRLRESVGPEIKRYGIAEAQRDGVIPAFDWEIRYAPYERDDEFVELSRSVTESFEAFRDRIESGEISTERRLRTFDDIRTFTHTTEGKALKRDDDAFRDLSTALFSRRMKRWHLAPSLDGIVEVVAEHRNDHVLVLVDSNAQVEVLTDLLAERMSTRVQAATSDQSREALRDQLDAFDESEDGGVVVGTGDLLGEGVDIPAANVAVNMATGGVNAQLVQRIGRVLRNPSEEKHARFYNVVGVPDGDAAVPAQDGRQLIEDAGEFCALGGRFKNLPGFATTSDMDSEGVSRLLHKGLDAIETLIDEGTYDWPSDELETTHLKGLLDVINESDDLTPASVLGEWSEYSWFESKREYDEVASNEARPLSTTSVSVVTSAGAPLESAQLAIETVDDQDATVFETGPNEWEVTLRGAGEAMLRATHPDFEPVSRKLTVAGAPEHLELEQSPRLQREDVEFVASTTRSNEDTVVCIVTDSDKMPISGVAVSVTNQECALFGVTDDKGRVELEGVDPNSEAMVSAHHPDFDVKTMSIFTPTNATVAVRLHDR